MKHFSEPFNSDGNSVSYKSSWSIGGFEKTILSVMLESSDLKI